MLEDGFVWRGEAISQSQKSLIAEAMRKRPNEMKDKGFFGCDTVVFDEGCVAKSRIAVALAGPLWAHKSAFPSIHSQHSLP